MATRTMRFNRDTGEYVYFLDDRPVTKARWDEDWHIKKTDFSRGECPGVRPDLDDFSAENSGRGRYNPQLSQYVTSVQDTKEKAAKKGFRVLG